MSSIINTSAQLQQARSERARKGLLLPRQLSSGFQLNKKPQGGLLSGAQLAERYPNVTFSGNTRVDPSVSIGSGAVIADSVIYGAGTIIGNRVRLRNAYVENSKIYDDVTVRDGNILDSTLNTGTHVLGGHVDKSALSGQSVVGEHASLREARVNNSKVFGAVSESDLTDTLVYVEGNVWKSQLNKATVRSDVAEAKLSEVIANAPVSRGEYSQKNFG